MCGAFTALGVEMEKSILGAFGERLGGGGGRLGTRGINGRKDGCRRIRQFFRRRWGGREI